MTNTSMRLIHPHMTTFADTSALYALLDRDDTFHERAVAGWRELVERRESLVTHNYVCVETVALALRRLGPIAVRVLKDDVFPLLGVFWVDESLYRLAMTALVSADRRDISLVDWVSFEAMRLRGVRLAFA